MNLVYYSQEDPRWANVLYSNVKDPKQTIGTSACGPTCFAMVASSLLDKPMLPPEAAFWAVEHGFRTRNNGTDWTFFKAIAEAKELTCKQTANLYEVEDALRKGALVIASMGPGHLTGGGHYVLQVGINGKQIDVFDPNHDNTKYGNDGLIDQGVRNDGKIKVQEIVFQKESKQYWIFTKEDIPMTTKEKTAFDILTRQVGELTSAVTTLTIQLKSATEQVTPPAWFEKEFGKDKVLDAIDTKTGTLEFWRALAVSLRLQGLGKGNK